jgi:Family of unknown function (DUF5683)
MRKLILFAFLLCIFGNLFSQEGVTIRVKSDSVKTKIPFKAGALSLFIPGGGQFYNEKYIKSAFVLVLEGSLIGLAIYHNYQSESFKDKFYVEDNLPSPNQDLLNDYSNKYVSYYEKMQSDLWWLGTVIFLSTIDAFVDAHLYDYEKRKSKIHLKFENNMLSLQYDF